MLMLAFCHTVIVEHSNGQTSYNASSPDEQALVSFAKYCGFEFVDMSANGNLELNKFYYYIKIFTIGTMKVVYNNQEYKY